MFSQKTAISGNPTANDVLFGRGYACQNHTGNLRLRKVAERYRVSYAKATNNHEKSQIVTILCQNMRQLNPPGRFLKRGKDGKYYALSDDESEVIAKVQQILRINGNVKNNVFHRASRVAKHVKNTAATTHQTSSQQQHKVLVSCSKRGGGGRKPKTLSLKSFDADFHSPDMKRVLSILKSLS